MKREKITVAVIEDVLALRENVCYYIDSAEDMEVDHESESIEDYFSFIDSYNSYSPHVLLLDIGLPGMSGLEALPFIREKQPETEVIMLTSYEDEATILKALCSGAVGYISKKASDSEVIDAIRIVVEGGSYMSPNIAREIVQHFVQPKRERPSNLLTDRQTEIIKKLVEGHSYSQIAEQLFVSVETVRTHIKKMYRALEVNNKAEAIAMYLRGEID